MQNSTSSQLHDATGRWCAWAEQLIQCASGEVPHGLALVREGILLRRRWDLLDRDAPPRRRLLKLLAAAQAVCHRRLADSLAEPSEPEPERVEQILRRWSSSWRPPQPERATVQNSIWVRIWKMCRWPSDSLPGRLIVEQMYSAMTRVKGFRYQSTPTPWLPIRPADNSPPSHASR